MANTTAVYARIDTGLKDNAEAILAQLGITPSSAITMLYRLMQNSQKVLLLCKMTGAIPQTRLMQSLQRNSTYEAIQSRIYACCQK